jgi:hypothetical protein
MERGNQMEAEALDAYNALFGAKLQKAGMFRNAVAGCSPDALIGASGILEIKTQKPELLVATIEADEFPAEHVAQCQGALWVCDRVWVDLMVYYTGMPVFVKRAWRDEPYMADLAREVELFNDDLAALVEDIRSKGCGTYAPPAASASADFTAVELET